MTTRARLPIALTIAGSDSGGGAGLQADLKTFAALSVHGVSAVTCLTAQNPAGVRAVQAASPKLVRAQLEAVFDALPPMAAKTGMLYSPGTIRTVAEFFRAGPCPPLIVDPVMVATSGASLLARSATRLLCDQLLPLAALITPNLDEAELLLGMRIKDEEGLREAARLLVRRFGCAALVKGGHLKGTQEAVDRMHQDFGGTHRLNRPQSGNPGYYTVDHSVLLYVIDPNGRLYAEVTPPFDAAALAQRMTRIARDYTDRKAFATSAAAGRS